jgi:hypothetical protein
LAAAFPTSNALAQVFDFPVPDPQGFTSNRSSLIATFGDAAGNALYVIEHNQVQTTNIGGIP